MNTSVLTRVGEFLGKNAPTILTAMGVGGMFGTAVCAAQAAIKSKEIVDSIDDWDEYEPVDKVKTIAPVFAPTVIVGAATASAIIGSNNLNIKRGLALTSAYTMAETALDNYKDKVAKDFGEKKANKIREEISQDKVNETKKPEPENITVCEEGNVALCLDSVSGRYFYSSIERLKRIEADLNAFMVKDGGWISLNDFYERVGLDDVSIGEDLGWDINGNGVMDIHYDATLTPDEEPCIVVNYDVKPKYRYYYGD